jgi:hypothetical protein
MKIPPSPQMWQTERERTMNIPTAEFPPRWPTVYCGPFQRFCSSHFRRKRRAKSNKFNPAGILPRRTMRLSIILVFLALVTPLDAAFAQLADTGNFHIVWEVKNRFRLFRNQADFLRQVAASRGDGVLAAERRLEQATFCIPAIGMAFPRTI